MYKKNYQIDEEEQDILDSFNRGEWKPKGENLDKYVKAAKKTMDNQRNRVKYLTPTQIRNFKLRSLTQMV
jgi:hypothetical protein